MEIAICDDDKAFCYELREKLIELFQKEEVQITTYYSGENFLSEIDRSTYEAVFLDYYMAGMTGFQVAEQLYHKHRTVKIIFLTSNAAMVYDAFEFQPFYFVCKDEYQQKLPQVVRKLQEEWKRNGIFVLDSRNDNQKIQIATIRYIISDGHNIVVYTTKYCYEVRKTMTQTQEELEQYGFIRIHKKYLVNIAFIRRVRMREEVVVLNDDTTLPISRRNKEQVMEQFRIYQRGNTKI